MTKMKDSRVVLGWLVSLEAVRGSSIPLDSDQFPSGGKSFSETRRPQYGYMTIKGQGLPIKLSFTYTVWLTLPIDS